MFPWSRGLLISSLSRFALPGLGRNAQNRKKKGEWFNLLLFRRPSLFTALPIRLRCMIICCQLLPTSSAALCITCPCMLCARHCRYYYDTFSIRLLRSFHTVPVVAVLLDTSPRPPHTSTECSHGNYSWTVMMDHLRRDHPRSLVASVSEKYRDQIKKDLFPWTTLKQSYHGADITPRSCFMTYFHICVFLAQTRWIKKQFEFLSGERPKIVWKALVHQKRKGTAKEAKWRNHRSLDYIISF